MCEFQVDFAHKIGWHGNVFSGIEKLTSDLSSTAIVVPSLQNWIKIGPVDVEIIGLTEIIKNKF